MLTSLILLVAVVAAFWLGWFIRDISEKLKQISAKLLDRDATQAGAPKSSIIEPREETPAERARREQEELIERLNPQ